MLACYTYPLRAQSYGDKPMDLAVIRSVIRGDFNATYGLFRERFFSGLNITSADYEESRRNVLVENELGVIMARRTKAMPKSWEFKADAEQGGSEDLADELNAWASGPICDRGLSLFAMTGAIDEDQEHDGNAALVMSGQPGALRLALRDTEQLGLEIDPLTQDFTGAAFDWSYSLPGQGGQKGEEYQYRHWITEKGSELLINGKAQAEKAEAGYGFLPLALIPRSVDRGSPIGKSGACELMEAYLCLLWCAYLMNTANKYEAHGVYCPPAGVDPSVFFDASGKTMTSFRISPGCFYPYPLQKVGGGINLASVSDQYAKAEATLYRLGMVKKDRGESYDMRSGKAMVIDTQELRDYIGTKLALRRAGLERVANMYAWATGKAPIGQPSGIVVECEALDTEDPQQSNARAELWLKARIANKCTTAQMLRQWQRLGLIDEDASADDMAREIDDMDASQMAQLMERQMAKREEPKAEDEEPEDDGAEDSEEPEVSADA